MKIWMGLFARRARCLRHKGNPSSIFLLTQLGQALTKDIVREILPDMAVVIEGR